MNRKRKSPAQRRDDAMSNVEHCMAELLRTADTFSLTGKAIGDYQWMRRELMLAARRYTRAMDSLARLRA